MMKGAAFLAVLLGVGAFSAGMADLKAPDRIEGYVVVRQVRVLGDTAQASTDAKAALAFLVQWADGRGAGIPVTLPSGAQTTTTTLQLVLPVRGFTATPDGLVIPSLQVVTQSGALAVGRGLLIVRREPGGKVRVAGVDMRPSR